MSQIDRQKAKEKSARRARGRKAKAASRKKDLDRKKTIALRQRAIESIATEKAAQTFNREAFTVGNNPTAIKPKRPVFAKKDGFDLASWGKAGTPVDNITDGKNPEEADKPGVDRKQPTD